MYQRHKLTVKSLGILLKNKQICGKMTAVLCITQSGISVV